MDRSPPERSSTSRPRLSRSSRRSGGGFSTSASAGDGLGVRAIRDLAERHSIRPKKSLGQNFLIDPNLARAIAAEAGAGPGVEVAEIGAGLGSLTVALAASGAHVLAIEFDRGLIPALREVVRDLPTVRVLEGDAMKLDWAEVLGDGRWTVCANLPYNISVPIVMNLLENAGSVRLLVVTVQKEVGERLAAAPGSSAYGAVSARVAYLAKAKIVRSIGPSVFWPRPKVGSVVVRLERLDEPAVSADPARLRAVIDAGFAQRRKTMRSALQRLGFDAAAARELLEACGLPPDVRAEELGLEAFAAMAEALG